MYVAILRGLNAGLKRPISMKDLSVAFTREGCDGVRTYAEGGNVIFDAENETLRGLPDRVSQRLLARFGCKSSVVLRSTSELRHVVNNNPFIMSEAEEEKLHVFFLSNTPTETSVDQLDAKWAAPDSFRVRGKEIYVQLPMGIAYTKLTSTYFDLNLRTVSVSRNWRTVRKLAEMTGA